MVYEGSIVGICIRIATPPFLNKRIDDFIRLKYVKACLNKSSGYTWLTDEVWQPNPVALVLSGVERHNSEETKSNKWKHQTNWHDLANGFPQKDPINYQKRNLLSDEQEF